MKIILNSFIIEYEQIPLHNKIYGNTGESKRYFGIRAIPWTFLNRFEYILILPDLFHQYQWNSQNIRWIRAASNPPQRIFRPNH